MCAADLAEVNPDERGAESAKLAVGSQGREVKKIQIFIVTGIWDSNRKQVDKSISR